LIQLPNANKDLFIFELSNNLIPVVLEIDTLSDPAKSTNIIFPNAVSFLFPVALSPISIFTCNIAWDREEF
jgi:hypothetical protein